MKACEIYKLSESEGIKNRRGGVYEMLKVIHQKWISRNLFRWVCDEMLCFSFLVCMGVKFQTVVHTHTEVLLSLEFSAMLVVLLVVVKASGTENHVWLWAEHGQVNMQTIIILQWEQSPKGTLRTILLKLQILCLLLGFIQLAYKRREAEWALYSILHVWQHTKCETVREVC